MTASELRELDAWIEAHLFGREVVIQEREDLPTIYKFKLELEYEYVPVHAYSTSVVSFALVKREIERRGWSWSLNFYSTVYPTTDDRYQFRLHSTGIDYPNVDIWASSEELAGCLAVKAAVEGSDG